MMFSPFPGKEKVLQGSSLLPCSDEGWIGKALAVMGRARV